MKRSRQRYLSLPIVMALFSLCSIANAAPIYIPEADTSDKDRMAVFQYVAQHGDRSHVDEMLDLIKTPHTSDYSLTLAYSLSCLGETQALPAIDQVIAWWKVNPIPYNTRLPLVRARLVAEDAGNKEADPSQRARVKVQTFLKEANLTVPTINAQIADYDNKMKVFDSVPEADDGPGPGVPVGWQACAELADIVYQSGDYKSYASLPEIKQIEFKDVPPANAKMQIAPLSQPDRIKALIDGMRKPANLIDFKIQLLVDEGEDARVAITKEDLVNKGPAPFTFVMQRSGGLELDPPMEKRFKTEDNAPISEPRYYQVLAY